MSPVPGGLSLAEVLAALRRDWTAARRDAISWIGRAAVGDRSGGELRALYFDYRRRVALIDAAVARPGFGAYAADQLEDYQPADGAAYRAACVAVRDYLAGVLPRDSAGDFQGEAIDDETGAPVPDLYTPAQTATLRGLLQAVVDQVSAPA